MNNNQNTKRNSCPQNQQNDNGWCNFKCISDMFNSVSLLCSFVGISLLSAIFFGLVDMLDYRKNKFIGACAHYMVIAAVILFFLALLLSYLHKDSEQHNPVLVHHTTERGMVLLENNHSEKVNTDNKLILNKLNCTKSNSDVIQSAVVETIKPLNPSSKTLKVGKSKQGKVGARTLTSNISSRNPHHAGTSKHKERKRNLPSRISPKRFQNSNTSHQGENTKTLSCNISCDILHHAGSSNQKENMRTMTSNISSPILRHASTYKRTENTRTVSSDISSNSHQPASSSQKGERDFPIISSETLLHGILSKHGERAKALSQSPNSSKGSSHVEKQLVSYERQFENPSHRQGFSPRTSNFNNFMSTNSLENSPAAEIVTTKKMTIFPGGIAQEEYRITRTAVYKCIWCPLGTNLENAWCPGHRISPKSVLGPNHNNPWCSEGNNASEGALGQNVHNDNPWSPLGGMFSQSESRCNLDSSLYSGNRISSPNVPRPNLANRLDKHTASPLGLYQPLQNKVSDVRSKFESMNILP